MTPSDIAGQVAQAGFAFTPGALTRTLLDSAALRGWTEFAASWGDLGLDTYMADGGRYRKRRHAAFAVGADGIARKPHQPHFQSRDYNPLNGGIERWFAPVADAVASGPTLAGIMDACRRVFDPLAPTPTWHVEVHQFRIEARLGQAGRPTPEGMHRDGVDYVLVLMVDRANIASGVTTIHDLDRRELGRFTLTDPLDAAFLDDRRVYHGVTPVEAVDAARPAHRDVLVVTFSREAPAGAAAYADRR